MSKREKALEEALEQAIQALNDWVTTYASDMCYEKTVLATRTRLHGAGGTLAYIAEAIGRARAALKP